MKKLLTMALVAGLLGATAVSSFAGGHNKYKKSDGLDDKFYEKVKFIMLHEQELGITDEQISQIKDLKYQVKKDLVMKKAEIKVVKIDIKKELWEDTIDTDKVNGMIDKKYELKRDKAKYLVASYAKLKNILSAEQKDKMKEIWMGYKKQDEFCKKR